MLQKIFFVSQVNKVSSVESADGREAVVKISSRETRVQVVVSRLLLTFTALVFFIHEQSTTIWEKCEEVQRRAKPPQRAARKLLKQIKCLG